MDESEQRVNRLVPFVRVVDVERSVGFYRHLGFAVQDVAKYRDRLSWASLQSEQAEIMLEGTYVRAIRTASASSSTFTRTTSRRCAISSSVREFRRAHRRVSPGPVEQLRVTDPDGYVLMIAQIE